jgi:pimeloyl-ACP methyl ester carboxylesterase
MIAHTRTGSGDPLLLIHGITHRRQGWRTVAPLLEDSFDVIVIDLPDHGESSELPRDYDGSCGPLADAIETFLREIDVERPHVAGNSLGGILALELAARGSIRTATALSPAGFWSTPERVWTRTLLGSASAMLQRMSPDTLRRTLDHPTGRRAIVAAMMAHPDSQATDDLVDDLRGLSRPRASFPLMLGALATWHVSGPVSVPTVVGWGTKDRILPIHQYRRLQRELPDAEIYSLPGCGHVPMGDDPQAVADLIRYAASR